MDITNKTDAELKAIADQIKQELADRKPRTTTIYLHRDKDDNYELAAELNLSDEATANFKYTGSEVAITIEVDRAGWAFATHFAGVALERKVAI